MKQADIYARVSSKDQEKEGFSIPAQMKLLKGYAQSHDLEIVREFIEVETAKITGRKQFGEMIRFFRQNRNSRTLIVEKTDRLYRNFRDYLTLEDLNVEIHLAKEGQVISENSKSQAKLVHGIQVVFARNYTDNLSEEVRKGMREKAQQGIYPTRPPFGYRNNKLERTIEVNPVKAPIVERMFELYATGRHSLASLRDKIRTETGEHLPKSYLERLLKNSFYTGLLIWEGKTYQGKHRPLVSGGLFDRVRQVFQGHNRPRYRKHEFAFSGLLRCAYDECSVTAEIKKEKYIYYHCTGYRGKCDLPYFKEHELGDRLGHVLRDIHIPDEVLGPLERAFQDDQGRADKGKGQELARLNKRLTSVRQRMDQAYTDKLDSKIPEDFWTRRSQEWQREEQQILWAIRGLKDMEPDRALNAARILELANKAYFLYLRQNSVEKGKLLKIVLSNCLIDDVSIYPTYRKPFDLILNAARIGDWYARGDSNTRPSDS